MNPPPRVSAGSPPTGASRVYQHTYPALVRLAVFLVGDLATAEDVCQEAFVACAGRLDAIDNPEAYLRTAVIHRSRKQYRKDRRARQTLQRLGALRPPIEAAAQPEWAIAGDGFLRLLSNLSEAQRTVVTLVYYLDLSIPDAAQAMGIPIGTAKSHNARALAVLRRSRL